MYYIIAMNKTIIVYGTRQCTDCQRSKKWLNENNVAYKEIFLEEDDNAIDFVLKVNNGMQSVPTIVFPDESILVEPSNSTLEAKIKTLGIM